MGLGPDEIILGESVVRNAGFEAISVPVEFAGPSDIPVTPQTQQPLTAY